MCFQFWYHMYGPVVGRLSVYLHLPGSFGKRRLWRKTGSVGPHWRHATIDLSCPKADFQVMVNITTQHWREYSTVLRLAFTRWWGSRMIASLARMGVQVNTVTWVPQGSWRIPGGQARWLLSVSAKSKSKFFRVLPIGFLQEGGQGGTDMWIMKNLKFCQERMKIWRKN